MEEKKMMVEEKKERTKRRRKNKNCLNTWRSLVLFLITQNYCADIRNRNQPLEVIKANTYIQIERRGKYF
jgi:hypothetical protein